MLKVTSPITHKGTIEDQEKKEFLQIQTISENQGPYTLPWEESTEIHHDCGSCGQSEILQDLCRLVANTTEVRESLHVPLPNTAQIQTEHQPGT